MHSAMNADEGDFGRVDGLQVFAVADGYQPVPGAMDDVGMTVYITNPLIGTQVIAQYIPHRQDGQEAGHYFTEVIVRRIEDEVTGFVVGSDLAGKSAADASAIYDDMVLRAGL